MRAMRTRSHTQFLSVFNCELISERVFVYVVWIHPNLVNAAPFSAPLGRLRLSGLAEGFSSEDEELITVCFLQHRNSSCQGLKAGPATFCCKPLSDVTLVSERTLPYCQNALEKFFYHRFFFKGYCQPPICIVFPWGSTCVLLKNGWVHYARCCCAQSSFCSQPSFFFLYLVFVPFRVFSAGFLLKYSANFCSN